ncbi:DUF692 domain-containing protein [Luteimonas sp. R10]|uniref:MNIO family bufferin maturase n=1 Tax=Luteimonas sp. R10 TaxID=3108176 RepID=UPI0030847121|nr:DUF692 domain-containing protein [Luteimonas sp. R10]
MNLPSSPSIAESSPAGTGLPVRAGVGFKPRHFDALRADVAPPGFIEVHAENYMGAGGAPHAQLAALRERLPLSLHGVGLSVGGEDPPDPAHLDRLATLIARYRPEAFSEHLAWSTHHGRFFNDLLPLRYDARTLDRVCSHIDLVQGRLGMRMLLENPATYLEFEGSAYDEPGFLSAIVRRTGCGLLLDVNNVHVSCRNHGHDPLAYLAALPLRAVGEIHLAGHAEERDVDGDLLLIDNHGSPVADAVWALYARTLAMTGPIATLIEWDNHVPDYATLREEARRAETILDGIGTTAQETAA